MESESLSQEQIKELQALRKDALACKARMNMKEKAERGIFPGCAPLGYKNVVVNGEKVIVIDPETAPKIKKLFELAARKKITVRSLVSIAADMGLKSRNGKPLGASSIHLILTNPFYVGVVAYASGSFVGCHLALVDKRLFQDVEGSLRNRAKR